MPSKVKLMLGCGPLPIHQQHLEYVDNSWTLIDAYINEPSIVKMDIRKLDYPNESVEQIYCSHTLEHISLKEIAPTLAEWYRVLELKGQVVINVPDMEWLSEEMLRLALQEEPRSKVFTTQQKLMEVIYGNQDHEGEYHKCGFTQFTLGEALIRAGFRHIEVERVYEAHDMGCLLAKAIK